MKYIKNTSHKENLGKKRPHLSVPRERPIARDNSLGEGNGGGNNKFALAVGKVIVLPRAGTAHFAGFSTSIVY